MGAGFFIPIQGRDLVVHWSSFWDEPLCWGTLSEIRDMPDHGDLTPERVERLLRTGATWVEEKPWGDDAGLIVRFADEDIRNLSGFILYARIPEMLDILTERAEEQPLDLADTYERMKALFVAEHQDPTDTDSAWYVPPVVTSATRTNKEQGLLYSAYKR